MPKPVTLALAFVVSTFAVMAQPDLPSGYTFARKPTSLPCLERKDEAQMSDSESLNRAPQSQPATNHRVHATAKITVQSSRATAFDRNAGPMLLEIRLNERFTGDIDGESPVRALQVLQDDRSASLVSVQRFSGKLGGRTGTFVLQGSETVKENKIKARWFVVPGSGTGELSGLRGDGGFEGEFGKGSNGTLDYWFE